MKKLSDVKLRVKLITGGLIAVLVPVLIVSTISVKKTKEALVNAQERSLLRMAQDLAMTADLFLDEEVKLIQKGANAPVLKRAINRIAESGPEGADKEISDLIAYLRDVHNAIGRDYAAFYIVDAKGNLILNSKGDLRADKISLASREYFKKSREGKPVISRPIVSKSTGLPSLVIAVPVKTQSGEFGGVFGATLKLSALSDKMTDVKIGKTGFPFMVDNQGLLLAHPKKEFIFKFNMKNLKGMEELADQLLSGKSGTQEYTFKGVKKLAGYAPIPSVGWGIGATQDWDEFMAPVHRITLYNLIVGAIAILMIGVLIFLWAAVLIRPINEAVKGLKDISEGEGDLTKRLTVSGKDEVGMLSYSFNEFIDKLHTMISDITAGVQTLSSASTELKSISTHMGEGSGQTSEKAATVAASAEEMNVNMNSVSAAMEQSSANVNSVAGAAEEMTSTINEIAKNAEMARNISTNAVEKVGHSTQTMNELGTAAQAIGKVVETITDISEQVNLLSLNATIEAARAGEAGKGFAVVANEIKALAMQTSEASMDIKEKITHIQESSSMSQTGMTEISDVIGQVSEIVATIAAAVEEQSSATREISENISQTSSGIEEVNQNVSQSSVVAHNIATDISGVNAAASEMADRSLEVQASAESLSGLASKLGAMVGRFKV